MLPPTALKTSKLQSVIAAGVCFLAYVTSGQMDRSVSSHGLHVCLHSGAQACQRQQLCGQPLFTVVPGPAGQHTEASALVTLANVTTGPNPAPSTWRNESSGRLSEVT